MPTSAFQIPDVGLVHRHGGEVTAQQVGHALIRRVGHGGLHPPFTPVSGLGADLITIVVESSSRRYGCYADDDLVAESGVDGLVHAQLGDPAVAWIPRSSL